MASYPELRDRVVAITGAANGIGETTARGFAENGSRLALLDIDDGKAGALAAELGQNAIAVHLDVLSKASVDAAVQQVLDRFGRIDVLVNCAGGYHAVHNVEQTDEAEWDLLIDLNLKSIYLMARAVMPVMKEQRTGRIISISSQAGRAAVTSSAAAYTVAKAGVIHLSRYLANELGSYGITVNNVAPGTTLTPRVAAFRTPEQVAQISAQIPLRRMAVTEDHAAAIIFLASDSASFVNGVTMDINGGRLML
ncbi:MAG: SDR family oxidoreductase [Chloroflexi bacterium]|nr:SDR family oxidoreductase [Chloroflexota bacterium]